MRTLLLVFVAKILLMPSLIFAAALLVKGYSSTGGGFAAGAVAGIAVLLQRIVFGPDVARAIITQSERTLALALGLGLPLGVTVVTAFDQGPFLTHMPGPGEHVIHLGSIELHTALVFEAGIGLLVLAFVLEAVRLVAPSRDADGRSEADA